MEQEQKSPQVRSIVIYLMLSMGITWLCWVPGLVIGGREGYVMPNFDTYALLFESGFENSQHRLLGILFQLGVYGPLIGGLVATWMDGGREGLARLWQRIAKWNIGGHWYLTALLVTVLMAGLPVAVFVMVGGVSPGAYGVTYILFVFVVQLFTSSLGEEPGWRGFLLPRFKTRYEDGDKFVWMLGLVWAVWHYPLVILQMVNGMPDLSIPQIAVTVLTSLAGFTMSIIGITFIYNWLYHRTGSLFLMIVFHALSNTLNNWFSSFLTQPESVTLLIALMPWAVVVFLQRRLGKEQFLGRVSTAGEEAAV